MLALALTADLTGYLHHKLNPSMTASKLVQGHRTPPCRYKRKSLLLHLQSTMYLVQRDSPKLGEHQPLCKSLKHAPLMAPSLPKTGHGRNQMKCLAVGVKPILCGNANPAKYVFFPLLLCIFSRFSNRLLTRPFWTARIHRHNEKCSHFLHAVFTAQTAAYRRVRLSRIGVYGLQG